MHLLVWPGFIVCKKVYNWTFVMVILPSLLFCPYTKDTKIIYYLLIFILLTWPPAHLPHQLMLRWKCLKWKPPTGSQQSQSPHVHILPISSILINLDHKCSLYLPPWLAALQCKISPGIQMEITCRFAQPLSLLHLWDSRRYPCELQTPGRGIQQLTKQVQGNLDTLKTFVQRQENAVTQLAQEIKPSFHSIQLIF